MRIATIDLDAMRLISCDGQVLKGTCNGCGKCCHNVAGEPCEFVYVDSWLDDAHTKPIYSCGHQFMKPVSCVLFPLPEETVPEGCPLHWEKE